MPGRSCEAAGGRFVEFDYERRVGGMIGAAAARAAASFALAGGFQLLVARDVHERYGHRTAVHHHAALDAWR